MSITIENKAWELINRYIKPSKNKKVTDIIELIKPKVINDCNTAIEHCKKYLIFDWEKEKSIDYWNKVKKFILNV